MTTLKSHSITVNNHVITYKTAGEGEPIILVHGLSASSEWWKRNIDALSQNYKIYLIDLPGYGSMRKHRKLFTLKSATSWLISWMEALNIEKAHLIGNSMGGYICSQIAVQRPELVDKLILVSAIGFPLGRTVFTSLFALLLALRYIVPSFFPVLLVDFLRAGPRMILSSTNDILSLDASDDLKRINVPTLLVWGDNDKLVPTTHTQLFQKAVPHSKLLIIPKAGHVPMFDNPQVFNKEVLLFLQDRK